MKGRLLALGVALGGAAQAAVILPPDSDARWKAVSAVDGDVFRLVSKRTTDSRFWGGPLFDAQGRLVGVQLTSLAGSKAISARVILRLIEERGLSQGSADPR